MHRYLRDALHHGDGVRGQLVAGRALEVARRAEDVRLTAVGAVAVHLLRWRGGAGELWWQRAELQV